MYLTFAWRYFKAKKSTNAINIIAWISVTAIAVGTASLIILLSVFNGFEGLVKSLYADFYTDLKVAPAVGNSMQISASQLNLIKNIEGIRSFSLVMEEKALLMNGDYQAIVYVKGVDSAYKNVAGISRKLIRGDFDLGTADQPAAVLGSGIEHGLSLESDRTLLPLTIYLPRKENNINIADPLQSLSAGQITTSGSFMIQQEFDNKYIITNLDFIKQMLSLGPNEYGGVEITLSDSKMEKDIIKKLETIFSNTGIVQTRYQQNKSLYGVMQMEKWVIYGILSLILVVAAFTMIGSLTMLVLEKQKDIQVLKAFGTSNGLIQKIFLAEGILLALIGGGLGVLLAVAICLAQANFHLVALQGGSFLVNYYPVKMVATDFLLVLLTVFMVAWIASWIPARKASLQPVALKS